MATSSKPLKISFSDAPLLSGYTGSFQDIPASTPLIAQQFEDNLLNNFQGSFSNFIESGQVWALLAGLVIGYIIRSLTSF